MPTPDASPTPTPVEIVRVSGEALSQLSLFWTMLAAFLGCLVAIGGALLVRAMVSR